MRLNFYDLFSVQNQMIQPKATVQLGAVTMGPGMSFSANGGVSFGGVDLSQFIGKDFDIEEAL